MMDELSNYIPIFLIDTNVIDKPYLNKYNIEYLEIYINCKKFNSIIFPNDFLIKLTNLKSLSICAIEHNNIEFIFPKIIYEFTQLEKLCIYGLNVQITNSIINLSNLKILQLS